MIRRREGPGARLRRRRAERGGDAGTGGHLRRLLARRAGRGSGVRGSREPVELPEGVEEPTPLGTCWVRRLHHGPDARHGAHALARARAVDGPRLAALAGDERVAALDARDCLFLDTETTGLMGGAGNTVFLCGMGFFSGEGFVLEQVFLRSFAEEPAALWWIGERLRARPWLTTFVGKSFDRHRLAARMAVQKVEAPVMTDRHLDLYHLARRAWKHELPDVRLRTVEERRLGLVRADDLPGSEAPAAFLDWIRDRTGPVDRVLEHNRLDVLSLVTLLGELGS